VVLSSFARGASGRGRGSEVLRVVEDESSGRIRSDFCTRDFVTEFFAGEIFCFDSIRKSVVCNCDILTFKSYGLHEAPRFRFEFNTFLSLRPSDMRHENNSMP